MGGHLFSEDAFARPQATNTIRTSFPLKRGQLSNKDTFLDLSGVLYVQYK